MEEKRQKEEKITDKTDQNDGISGDEHRKKKKKDDAKKDAVIDELKKTLSEKEEIVKSLQDKMLYMQADFENFKKIKNKEKQDVLKFGNEVLIKDLLPVVDNLERALEHASKTDDFKSIHDGVKIVLNEFLKVLEKAGVQPVEALGQKFDPNFHEAFFQEERKDVEPEIIVSEHLKGYVLNGRLIRPSLVSISKHPEK
ncbi:MAG TPA: nucleotide exchange factor GrpE [Syntrophorhabdaceae bacterium]|jgi:molecular chaperone GrpE|nr:nucleotide exchange factor GrpE [Syntrophorhabdaceae bacterium]MDI9562023.1 nucleotide exchange factor GrpE [Pseudomonadota bacterium]MBV6506327.1 Protein GrpE [Syntrophorhabdaceae bacterium]HNQ63401.1 nucleotide exchange factor GrpE [Syntrophorhabdaceae bacterium]HNZ59202.1 nucleotide exchange factor GrpE [Syntrophorhabdaceae bacterium]